MPARRPSPLAYLVLTLAAATGANAGAAPADKAGHTLFDPTPAEWLRELSPDRPDATESPITVDAGHVQLELSFLAYGYDETDREITRARTLADTNLRIGLTNATEVQLIFAAHGDVRVEPPSGPRSIDRGLSDLTLRLKWNLWGNDSGDSALAVMPFVTIPTGTGLSTDETEGGVIVTFGRDLADRWGIGTQLEIDVVYDAVDSGYDTELAHTLVVGFDVRGPLGAYVEYVGILSGDGTTGYRPLASTGLTLRVGDDLIFDVGARIGLADEAADLDVFTGMTLRF